MLFKKISPFPSSRSIIILDYLIVVLIFPKIDRNKYFNLYFACIKNGHHKTKNLKVNLHENKLFSYYIKRFRHSWGKFEHISYNAEII